MEKSLFWERQIRKRKSVIVLSLFVVIGILMFAGCGAGSGSNEENAADSGAAEDVETKYAWTPEKAITIVLPTAAGDYYDAQARIVSKYMEQELGQPVTIEYMPGAGQALAAKYVYDAAPDGYTIGYASSLPLVMNRLAYGGEWDYTKLNYFATCMDQINDPAYLFLPVSTQDNARIESWDDVLNATDPVRWASVGEGSAMHVVGVILSVYYDFPITHILGYSGGPEVLAGIARGESDSSAMGYSVSKSFLDSEEVKGIFTIGKGKSPHFPDVRSLGDDYPELAEALATRHLLYGPPEMDAAVRETLSKVIYEAVQTDEMKKVHEEGISDGLHWIPDDGAGTKEFILKLADTLEPLLPYFKSE
jgi:tripartite-type tricarboxylate transporter receptor subunit TctC